MNQIINYAKWRGQKLRRYGKALEFQWRAVQAQSRISRATRLAHREVLRQAERITRPADPSEKRP